MIFGRGFRYKTLLFANIIIVPILIAVIFILVFPFFPSICLYLNKDDKSAEFFVKIFGIKVFYAAAMVKNNGLYVKKTFKKPYLVKLSVPTNIRGNIKKIKKIGILSVDAAFNIGLGENDLSGFLAVSTLQNVQIAVFNALKTDKPHLKLKNEINVYDNSDAFNAVIKIKTIFNLIDVLTVLFYNLTEKIHYGITK